MLIGEPDYNLIYSPYSEIILGVGKLENNQQSELCLYIHNQQQV